jgi:hypothetical protein
MNNRESECFTHLLNRGLHASGVKSPAGYPMQSPYIAVANRQAEMMRIASEFGFTPAQPAAIPASCFTSVTGFVG